jgi:hypothetical protein
MPTVIARMLGLGAYGACAGIAGLYLLVAYISRPTATGGIDPTQSHVVWIALGGLTVGLLVAHHVFGRQLLILARDGDRPQPLGAK